MADLRISELYLHETLQLSDLLPIVNSNSTRRVTTGTLGTFILASNLPITSSGAVFNGDVFVNGNLNVSSLVSASIIFESGSTIFGNDITDTHTFTGSIFISGAIAYPEWIDFELTNDVTPQTGRLWWDPNNGTLDIGLTDNVVVSIGEELVYPYVVNSDTVDLPLGTLVMVDPNTVSQGQRLRVIRAITDGTYQADLIMGVTAQTITQNNQGYVNWFGQVRNVQINTLEDAGLKDENETWVEGNILYPDPDRPGGLTNVRPEAPALKSTIAVLTTVNGNNANLLVRPSLGPRIQDINNLQINSLTQGELIMWDTGSNYFKTTTQLSGSYGVTGSVDVTGSLNVDGYFSINGNRQFNDIIVSNSTTLSGSANTEHILSFNTDDNFELTSGVRLVDGNKLTADHTGLYSVELKAQVAKTDSGADQVSIWFKKDGTNIANSNNEVYLVGNNAKQLISFGRIVRLNAGQYVQIAWASAASTIQFQALGTQTTPVRPATPSVIARVIQIS